MKITWSEEPAMTFNHIVDDAVFAFPRNKPFTQRNIIKYINSIADGTISKLKLPDSYQNYLKNLKHVKKITTKDNFADVVMDKTKDIALLVYDGADLNHMVKPLVDSKILISSQ
jgi:hypothetical protein